jgi:hypothetical protein
MLRDVHFRLSEILCTTRIRIRGRRSEDTYRRKIRLIECNAKCRYLKNWPLKGLCGRCFIFLRPPPLRWPYTPPPLTHCVHVHTVYLFTLGGWGEEITREKNRGAIVYIAGRKYEHDWLYLQSIKSSKHQWRRHLGFCVFIVSVRYLHGRTVTVTCDVEQNYIYYNE